MKKKSNLTLFMKQLIRSLKEEERFSTAHIYQSTLNAFMLFCKTDAIRFNQMERSRLKQFENHLRNKGCTSGTLSPLICVPCEASTTKPWTMVWRKKSPVFSVTYIPA
ncbi:phage integrase SAM-like domain-containing protein [Phocaeicola vulgatus]|uniref:phage integrase SAM-like domain-containing protein n=1 Tax=Phocaeicola vulgatus TaxID=821 RepID=UPI002162B6A3|nr:phage integrase SAM-like domain-containing protein [Phocaeicola vulgatus]UVO93883.1 phage integrase SAM-like domain-containing protein [Phocaeicola vulgatus]